MATNYDKSGDVWNGPAPEDVDSGQAIAFGDVGVGISLTDALAGDTCVLALTGVWEVPFSGSAATVGQVLNLNVTTGEFSADSVPTGGINGAGIAFSDSADGTVRVKINAHIATVQGV